MKSYRQSIVLLFLCVSAFVSPLRIYGEEATAKTGPFLVNDYGWSGMFAAFSGVLGSLDVYESGNYAGIKIDMVGGVYLDPARGSNWWEYYFEPINVGDESAPHQVFTLSDHLILAGRGFFMPRHRAFELIQRYIHVKPHILEKVNEFAEDYFNDCFVIGVHHRGTDKVVEQPLVPYAKTIATLNAVIEQLTREQAVHLRIFVATDDSHFLNYMLNLYPDLVVFKDHVRSDNDQPLHYGNDDKYQSIYQKGEEALLDCLLLSRCNFLIRPDSSLSIMADHFNPDMPMIVLRGDH